MVSSSRENLKMLMKREINPAKIKDKISPKSQLTIKNI
jgi:hypothetical protein